MRRTVCARSWRGSTCCILASYESRQVAFWQPLMAERLPKPQKCEHDGRRYTRCVKSVRPASPALFERLQPTAPHHVWQTVTTPLANRVVGSSPMWLSHWSGPRTDSTNILQRNHLRLATYDRGLGTQHELVVIQRQRTRRPCISFRHEYSSIHRGCPATTGFARISYRL
jgi:hypothetical protein